MSLVALKLGVSTIGLFASAAGPVHQLDRALGLATAVMGLLLLENVYSATDRGSRWAMKYLLIAAGFVFAFDMFRYSDALLIRQFSDVSLVTQSLLSAIVAPLLVVAAARIRHFSIVIHVARRFVLQTSALVFSGAYLLAVALAGLPPAATRPHLGAGAADRVAGRGARAPGRCCSPPGRPRAHGRRLVERSFFNFAYDYREEWLRFVATMASGEAGGAGLHERAIRAAAEPLDCSAGLLYLREQGDRYRCAAAWNWAPGHARPPAAEDCRRNDRGRMPATLVDLRDEDGGASGPSAPRGLGCWWAFVPAGGASASFCLANRGSRAGSPGRTTTSWASSPPRSVAISPRSRLPRRARRGAALRGDRQELQLRRPRPQERGHAAVPPASAVESTRRQS